MTTFGSRNQQAKINPAPKPIPATTPPERKSGVSVRLKPEIEFLASKKSLDEVRHSDNIYDNGNYEYDDNDDDDDLSCTLKN